MSRIVVVDCTYLMHRAWHVRPNAVQYMILGWLCQYVLEEKATHVIAAFDSGRSFRHDLIKAYKGTRTKRGPNEAGPDDTFDVTVKYLQSLGIHCEFGGRAEADDVLATVGYQWPKLIKKGIAILATKDKDNLQGITDSCYVLKPGTLAQGNKIVTAKELLADTGLSPAQYLDYQTLIGDSIDNIPKILSPAKAKKLILEAGSLKAYMKQDFKFANENAAALNTNRRLVKLLTNCFELTPDSYKVSNMRLNVPSVKSTFYKKLSEDRSTRRLF